MVWMWPALVEVLRERPTRDGRFVVAHGPAAPADAVRVRQLTVLRAGRDTLPRSTLTKHRGPATTADRRSQDHAGSGILRSPPGRDRQLHGRGAMSRWRTSIP